LLLINQNIPIKGVRNLIDEVIVKNLKVIPDERGRLIEILRNDDEIFDRFGQVYVSVTNPGVIKGWHMHKLQNDFIACIKGMLKLVLFDNRKHSDTNGEINEFFIGDHNPVMIKVPKDVYHGWKCISKTEAVAINIPTLEYNYDAPDEYRLPFNSELIPYNWDLRHE
jgi:dTDP-4-dehydrorhamnose 3,5-epimerase